MHGDTNRQNRPIASLVVWPFFGAQSLNFWNSIQQPTMMMESKRNLALAGYLSAGICIGRTYILKLADLCFPGSLMLFNLVSMFSYSIWALKLERFSILLLLFHWNRFYFLLLRRGIHLFSCFSTRAEIPFRLHGIFFRFFSPAKNLSPVFQNGIGFSARAESFSM